jgi:predicted RNA-binding Zn ribbon-like protein
VNVSIESLNQPSPHRTFELIAGHPALDLVNTLDWRFRESGTEEFLESYDDLLSFCEQSRLFDANRIRQLRHSRPAGTSRELAAVRQLREAAATVFYAAIDQQEPPTVPLKVLEGSIRSAHKHQRLFWTTSGMAWRLTDDGTANLPRWLLALSIEALLISGEIPRIRACDNPDCRWLFLDTSKNHTRRWCDMKICGNRMKARRFKALHRA